ncbi:hypothetical protein [Nocardia niigatensis]|uniref:hypothetical protein n=1 Tax=Nocardia niigatensis TaxID=209249 RepID=UPI00030075C0|nr:hypothetical protein [Nocardia niigatensis]
MNDRDHGRNDSDHGLDDSVLDRLRRADPLAGTNLDTPADRDRAAALFARITAESRAAGEGPRSEGDGDELSRRRGARSSWVLGLAAAVVVIAVAVAFLVLPNLFRDNTATASAAELLRDAATATASNPAGFQRIPGQASAYQQVMHSTVHQGPGYRYSIDSTVRTEVRAGGQAVIETTTGEPHFVDEASRKAWVAAGSPPLTGPVPGTSTVTQPLVYQLGGQMLSWAQLGALPTGVVTLVGALTATALQQSVYRSAVQLLQAPAVPAALQAALYRVLAEQPGLTATEHAGAVSISRAGEPAFTFDRATGQLLRVDRSTPSDPSTVIQSAGLTPCVAPLSAPAPSEIYIGCATGAYILDKLHWTGWGENQATATGTAGLRDCTPNCAAGPTTVTPVEVTIGQPQTCGYNLRIYTRVDMRYPKPVKGLVNGGTGPDRSGTADWWNLACPKG